MKKNLYFRNVMKRENALSNFILSLAYQISSYPRLLIEVFIRKKFGHRYYRDSSAITAGLFMAFLPFIGKVFRFAKFAKTDNFWMSYASWYIYLAAFISFCFQHSAYTKKNRFVMDKERYSLNSGELNPLFLKYAGNPPNVRLIETTLEPLPFLIAGILLMLIGQKLGGLLIFCSVIYSLSYVAAYKSSDNFLMDLSDEKIANEEMEKVFVDGASPDEANGFEMRGYRPGDKEYRKDLVKMMVEEKEDIETVG